MILTLNKKTFEKEIGKLDEKMQHKIAMFGTPIEEINNKEIQIEIFPNRPDLLSYHGFKRSFVSFLGIKKGMKKYNINPPERKYEVKIDSFLKNIRPYTACAIMKNLKFNDEKIKELIDIQEKLHFTLGRKRKKMAIGIYPLEKIEFPIFFKALEPDKIKFIPLDSNKEMSGLEILQKHPAGKEYAHLLSGKVKFPIFIDSKGDILSMPPVINSQLTGKITEKTKDIFIECSGFDFPVLSKCLNIIVTILSDMDGEIYQMEIHEFNGTKTITPDFTTEKMKISVENTNKLLGLALNEKNIKELLEKMGYNYEKGTAEVPPWRTDVLHEVDLIEDIAIAYGYDNLIPKIPEISTIGEEDFTEIIKRKIAEILTGLNMLEISNYHLTKKTDQFSKMGIKIEKDFIEIEKSKTDYTILRKDLTHYLMKIISENIDSEYPQQIFEIGKVFEQNNSGIIEKENLASAIVPGNFTQIKQILEYLFRMLGKKIILKEPENFPSYFIDGRVAEIILFSGDNKNLAMGFVGEIHPRILKSWKIKLPVALFEISFDEIFKKLNK